VAYRRVWSGHLGGKGMKGVDEEYMWYVLVDETGRALWHKRDKRLLRFGFKD
jgi:hypothetical protein